MQTYNATLSSIDFWDSPEAPEFTCSSELVASTVSWLVEVVAAAEAEEVAVGVSAGLKDETWAFKFLFVFW